MRSHRLKFLAALTIFFAGASAGHANAAFIISSSVGGAATGVNYANFDNLPLGTAGGTSGGITVSYLPDGQTVNGTSSGFYAAPYISNSNGTQFGDFMVSGADTTNYLSTGLGSVTLMLPGSEQYLGLLWGSVDNYNNLAFYSGATLIGTINGAQILASPNGDQGVNGTLYANITSDTPFDRVVASSTQYAFEFDNVAYNPTIPTNPVPEPLSLGLVELGMAGIGLARRRKNKTAA